MMDDFVGFPSWSSPSSRGRSVDNSCLRHKPFVIEDINLFLHPLGSMLSGPPAPAAKLAFANH